MGKWTQEDTLERWKGEHEIVHRAMLLWVMQHPGPNSTISRSIRAAAKAIGRAEGSLRDWHRTHRWEQRAAAHPEAESQALAIYRKLYLQDFGESELSVVASRVIVPLHETGSGAVISQARAESTAAARVERAVIEDVLIRRKQERVKVEQFRALVDAALGETARLLKDKKLHLTAKDIPSLLTARHTLTEWLTSHDDRQIETRQAVESARVKHAKETGRDVLDAVWQDLDELRTILGVLRVRRDETDAGAVRREYASSVEATPSPPIPKILSDVQE